MTRQPLIFSTAEIVASPVDPTETVIAILGGVASSFDSDVFKLFASAVIGPDAGATDINLFIRADDINGAIVGVGGGDAPFAAGTSSQWTGSATGVDAPSPCAGKVYVLTATCTDAAAVCTVGLVSLQARSD